MGFNICHVAAPCAASDLAQALGLAVRENTPDQPDGEWWAARLRSGGWSLLWSEDEEFGRRAEARIAELSREVEVVLCVVNETVMFSSAELWRDGALAWRVSHRGDGEDIRDLTVTGTPPLEFEEIRARLFARQDADDGRTDYVFDIPVELAEGMSGFRHDGWLEDGATDGYLLVAPERAAPVPRKGLWARLLGL